MPPRWLSRDKLIQIPNEWIKEVAGRNNPPTTSLNGWINVGQKVYYSPEHNKTVMKNPEAVEVFSKKGVLRNFAKFTGKHVYQGLCQALAEASSSGILRNF